MEKTKKYLVEAFDILGEIPVKGSNVELMATARRHLRLVYAELEQADKAKQVDKATTAEEVENGVREG